MSNKSIYEYSKPFIVSYSLSGFSSSPDTRKFVYIVFPGEPYVINGDGRITVKDSEWWAAVNAFVKAGLGEVIE